MPVAASEIDSLVNYCTLMDAGYTYGIEFARRQRTLSPGFLESFNAVWKDVFTMPVYQKGIEETEFMMGSRFSEGNPEAFPPSSVYGAGNPDTYMLFHLSKEIGMIHSAGFETCPSCVDQSIAKAGAYLTEMPFLEKRISEKWPYYETIPRMMTVAESDTLWQILHCILPSYYVDPHIALDEPGTVIIADDTLYVQRASDIAPKFLVIWHTCDKSGVMRTSPPQCIHGRENTRGAIYQLTISAMSECGFTTERPQYFVLGKAPK